jgi:hypothetical protein
LGGTAIEKPFFVDERREAKGIRLTDEMRKLAELKEHDHLAAEVEGRWRVVETGWELGLNAGLIEYDRTTGKLSIGAGERRLALRSCRDTLNGYQKGRCFYCYGPISIQPGPLAAEVDHWSAAASGQPWLALLVISEKSKWLQCAPGIEVCGRHLATLSSGHKRASRRVAHDHLPDALSRQ